MESEPVTMTDLIQITRKEIGYIESKDGKTKYWSELFPNEKAQPWCLPAVEWCMVQAYGVEPAKQFLLCNDGFVKEPYILRQRFKECGRLFYNPQPKDIAFFRRGRWTDHAAIVTEINGTMFKAVDWNYKNSDGIGTVVENEFSIDDKTIVGFGRPDYSILEAGL